VLNRSSVPVWRLPRHGSVRGGDPEGVHSGVRQRVGDLRARRLRGFEDVRSVAYPAFGRWDGTVSDHLGLLLRDVV
jgi:hypothetical protein